MGNTAVEWYLKFHGGIDVDEKGTARRNNSGGGDGNHRILDRRVPAEWLRCRHDWRRSEGGSLSRTHADRCGHLAVESRGQGPVPERQGPDTREEREVPPRDARQGIQGAAVQRGVSRPLQQRGVSRSAEQRNVSRSVQQRSVSRSAEQRSVSRLAEQRRR